MAVTDDLPDLVPLRDRLFRELDDAQRSALDAQELVEPNEDERRNGWTAESLTAYLAERKAGQTLAIDPHSIQRRMAAKPRQQNSKYNIFHWRNP